MGRKTQKGKHWHPLFFALALLVLGFSSPIMSALADEEEIDWEELFFHAYNGEGEEQSRCLIVRRGEEALAFTDAWEGVDVEDCYVASSYDAEDWYQLEYVETVNEEMYCWLVPEFDDWDAVLETASPRMGEECIAIYSYPKGNAYAYDYDLAYIDELAMLFDDGTAAVSLLEDVSGMGEVPAILCNEDGNCIGILFEEGMAYVEWFDEAVFNAGVPEEESEAEDESETEEKPGKPAQGGAGGGDSVREERQESSTAEQGVRESSAAESRATDILDETTAAAQDSGNDFPVLPLAFGGAFTIALLGGVLALVLSGRKKKQGGAGNWNAGSAVYVPQQGSPEGASPWLFPQGGFGGFQPQDGGNAPAWLQNQGGSLQGMGQQPAWPQNPGGDAVQKASGYATPTVDPFMQPQQGQGFSDFPKTVKFDSSAAPLEAPAGMAAYQLSCRGGYMDGRTFPLPEGGIRIGRAADCGIRFPEDYAGISRNHAEIRVQGGVAYITDTSSTGVYIERLGGRIPLGQAVEIYPGEEFWLGERKNGFLLLPKSP